MNKVYDMLVRERDACKVAIEHGSFLDSFDSMKEKKTPEDAQLKLVVLERLIIMAENEM